MNTGKGLQVHKRERTREARFGCSKKAFASTILLANFKIRIVCTYVHIHMRQRWPSNLTPKLVITQTSLLAHLGQPCAEPVQTYLAGALSRPPRISGARTLE